MIALGIDLGTANVRAAVYTEQGPELIAFPSGTTSLPAVVSLGGGVPRIGASALARAATHPLDTVRDVKRMLGLSYADLNLDGQRLVPSDRVGQGEEGELVLHMGGSRVTPDALVARLFDHVAEVVEMSFGARPEHAVLSAPRHLDPTRRAALEAAARRAGLGVPRILDEAVATVLSLQGDGVMGDLVAVVDVGAAACTATILQIDRAGIRTLSSSTATAGGDEVDALLVHSVLEGLVARHGEFDRSAALLELVRQCCERAKRDLAHVAALTVAIPFLPVEGGVHSHEVVFRSDVIEVLLHSVRRRVASVCQEALDAASVRRLSTVIAVGGMTKVPAVRAAIETELGPIASRHVHPDGSVALGAARYAAMLAGLTPELAVGELHGSLYARGESESTTTMRPSKGMVEASEDDDAVAESFRNPSAAVLAALRPQRLPSESVEGAAIDGLVRNELDPAEYFAIGATVPAPPPESTAWVEPYLSAPSGDAESADAAATRGRALAHRAREMIQAGAWERALDTLDTIEESLAAPDWARTLPRLRKAALGALMTHGRIRALCDDVVQAEVPPARWIEMMTAALDAFPGDGFHPEAIELYRSARSFEVGAALLSYVERFADLHGREVGGLLAEAREEDALHLLATLSRRRTQEAARAIASGIRSDSPVVRLQTLTCLQSMRAAVRWEELQLAVADPDEEVRRLALSLVSRRAPSEGGMFLAQRIRSKEFDRLEDTERRMLLDAAAAINRRRAESIAIEILDDASVFGLGANDQSRAIAAEFLSGSDAPEALEALERNAGRRFRNSSVVRKSASQAAHTILVRRSTLPPAASGRS